MATYRVIGYTTRRKSADKRYASRRTFKSVDEAVKWMYKQVYNPSGNTQKAHPPFYNPEIVQVIKTPKRKK
ncbi:MAG: hypothetical protein K9G46_07175 [Flavobacteriales bacterium]|nr:hypothetical protein [Flavobacteriales bacterium]